MLLKSLKQHVQSKTITFQHFPPPPPPETLLAITPADAEMKCEARFLKTQSFHIKINMFNMLNVPTACFTLVLLIRLAY